MCHFFRAAHSLPCAFVLLSTALSGYGCLPSAAQLRGYPLYSLGTGPRPPRSQVAELSASLPGGASVGTGSSAFIKSVDGRDVAALDTAFELKPGCHIVQTESRLLLTNEVMIWSGELGSRTFPLRMKAGYAYTVVVEMAEHFGGTARVSVFAVERDPSGSETQIIPAATSPSEVLGCRAWSPPSS
jgi:hypothetical protein